MKQLSSRLTTSLTDGVIKEQKEDTEFDKLTCLIENQSILTL